jgi:hypothetical protein
VRFGKLNQLNIITRHDIFNMLTGFISYVQMAQIAETLPEVRERLTLSLLSVIKSSSRLPLPAISRISGPDASLAECPGELREAGIDLSGTEVKLNFEKSRDLC